MYPVHFLEALDRHPSGYARHASQGAKTSRVISYPPSPRLPDRDPPCAAALEDPIRRAARSRGWTTSFRPGSISTAIAHTPPAAPARRTLRHRRTRTESHRKGRSRRTRRPWPGISVARRGPSIRKLDNYTPL